MLQAKYHKNSPLFPLKQFLEKKQTASFFVPMTKADRKREQ
jgi:hypothetical protein